MTNEMDVKKQVREFYDQVGWTEISDGFYQNARYEDLRPVSKDYIHRCHLRVLNHLSPSGRYLLDAGSGPIQYPEYLLYSEHYNFRVCADISIKALIEARKRIGDHGLFVVADVAKLPFLRDTFEGVVSLHTIHHLQIDQHLQAYQELYRVLLPDHQGVVVNGWYLPPFARILKYFRMITHRIKGVINHRILGREQHRKEINPIGAIQNEKDAKSTFVDKNHPSWFTREIASRIPLEIFVWRSISVKDLRTFIYPGWGGRGILRVLFWLEDRFPNWFGMNGQYPLVVIKKMNSPDRPF